MSKLHNIRHLKSRPNELDIVGKEKIEPLIKLLRGICKSPLSKGRVKTYRMLKKLIKAS